jgi:imidazoleglycerol phosphate dehydratase HisB
MCLLVHCCHSCVCTSCCERAHSYQCCAGGVTLHIRKLAGHNSHHIVEATFKSFARALRQATEVDPRRQGMIASSKGVLTQQ